MSRAIEVDGLVRDSAGTLALDGVNLTVATGQVLGLLGPNGPIRCAHGHFCAFIISEAVRLRQRGAHVGVGGCS